MGSARHALEFKQIIHLTPDDLQQRPTNIYSQIAIALKGGELRKPGLANLAARLAVRVERSAHIPDWLLQLEGVSSAGGLSAPSRANRWKALPKTLGLAARRSSVRNKSIVASDINVGGCRPEDASAMFKSPKAYFRSSSKFSARPLSRASSSSRASPST
eukprot:5563217-Prymnesium_polylepis.2